MDSSDWITLLYAGWTTIWVSGVSIVFGIILGLVVAMLRAAKIPVVSQALAVYVSLIRATPMVTLVLFLFVIAPSVGWEVDARVVAIAAMTINTTAFNAEIWRSALTSFSREQLEAAKAAGMTTGLTLRRIMLPQMLTTSLPGLVNEMSLLVKSSPAIAMIGIVDLTRVTNRIAAVTYDPLPPILAAGLLYILIIGGLVRFQRIADSRAKRLAM
ncbi:amine acid ABC transporter, permease protein, 3-TM region, His/Glu/Gln/Arg/opine family [Pseudomonas sp. GM33]|jgi:polar amino acid transport system permease protein|uniref:amino acid ABC transporter permease n=1 Tax=Pseudomonas TaxID=286 RepID=UPI0002703CF1|nr:MULTISPECIES: amino acid ABC transporter permease [Pseudomonas]EJM35100.1 amine acid ABC transporter, permease protein, 3-TM region, His/Glu/Gln/Arg/opine family [Pseudomonas sp. GM33]MDP9653734.1 polar amino acid transport system permease protein [Pseudomonas putida]PNB74447.1 amino acid ABC transporter permease [Pseudomonas sp. GW456-E7]QXH59382.1 amino acid ABC transporter permease [Pseudomonas azerbaijanorientalis]